MRAKRRHRAEQIIGKLREAKVQLTRGVTVQEASRALGITEQTYYRWRKEYGGLRVDQAKRLKELERENARLRRAVSDLTLEAADLEGSCRGNWTNQWGQVSASRRPVHEIITGQGFPSSNQPDK